MKSSIIALSLLAASFSQSANAQVGEPYIHDPSTIAQCDDKYYTFGTGEGGLWSADGWTWHRGAVRPGRGAAPDVVKIGDRYLVAYSTTGGGLGGTHRGSVVTMWNKTLDPKSPDFHYSKPIVVASSADDEDCDAIDAGLLLDPTTGRLWLTYGTYFGYIRLVELDPDTGMRLNDSKPTNIAIDCEATTLVYRDGWYYLLGTHGTCCDGPNSTYNIVVGRSRAVTGPYLDNMGRDMLHGGGRMVIAAGHRQTGAGHFGRFVVEEGVEKMSCHFEADFDRGGRSVLAIRPLLWQDGWPVTGEPLKEQTYEIESVRRGYALELAVDFQRIDYKPFRFWEPDTLPVKPMASQTLEEVQSAWPKGNIGVRAGDYMFRPHQRWTITAVPEAGGYLGGAWYKIEIEGTHRALAVDERGEVTAVATFSGADNELWRIDQLTDGTYRIVPRQANETSNTLCLSSTGDTSVALMPFDMTSDNSKWRLADR